MKQIKCIIEDGSGAMLSEDIGYYIDLTLKVGNGPIHTKTLSFDTKIMTLSSIHEKIVILHRCLGTVAEGLRAQIEEGESA